MRKGQTVFFRIAGEEFPISVKFLGRTKKFGYWWFRVEWPTGERELICGDAVIGIGYGKARKRAPVLRLRLAKR